MILAAGRGERMRPLTDQIPKPLLPVGGRPLIDWHLGHLAAAGFCRVVINLAHLGEQIKVFIGDGGRWGLEVSYSEEPPGALETGGGICNALKLFRTEPILVINGDIWTDIDLTSLACSGPDLAHLVLVENPFHNRKGDFALQRGRIANEGEDRYTFSGIGLYRRSLFEGSAPGAFPLAPLLRRAADAGRLGGELFRGAWYDIGTPQRLAELDARLSGG